MPGISALENPRMEKLYHYARLKDEFATTQLWEYILRTVFHSSDRVLSSQQPPSYEKESLRRVDFVVKFMDEDVREERSVLFMEAKKAGAAQADISTAETQAYDAAMGYSVWDGKGTSVWAQTCIGTSIRFWIYDPASSFLEPFLPGSFDLGHLDEYLDVEIYADEIKRAMSYIAKHHIPPAKFLSKQTPPITTASYSPSVSPEDIPSPARAYSQASSSVRGQIPLTLGSWVQVNIKEAVRDTLVGCTMDGVEITFKKDIWKPQKIDYEGSSRPCWAYILGRDVYWTWTRDPARTEGKGKGKMRESMQPSAEGGRQYQASSPYDTVPAAGEPSLQQGSQLDVKMRNAGNREEQERKAEAGVALGQSLAGGESETFDEGRRDCFY